MIHSGSMQDFLKTPEYDFVGGSPSLDFANTVGGRRGATSREYLETYENLLAWSVQAGLLPEPPARELAREAQRRPQLAQRALVRARGLREAIHSLFSALAAGRAGPGAALEALNATLAEAMPGVRLAAAAGNFIWQLTPGDGELAWPQWAVARDAAELLTSNRWRLVRECAGEACSWLFLDATRNHSRHWCTMKGCGNRAKVRRHRARLAHGG